MFCVAGAALRVRRLVAELVSANIEVANTKTNSAKIAVDIRNRLFISYSPKFKISIFRHLRPKNICERELKSL